MVLKFFAFVTNTVDNTPEFWLLLNRACTVLRLFPSLSLQKQAGVDKKLEEHTAGRADPIDQKDVLYHIIFC